MNKKFWIFPALGAVGVIFILMISKDGVRVAPETSSSEKPPLAETVKSDDGVSPEKRPQIPKRSENPDLNYSDSEKSGNYSGDNSTSDTSGLLRVFGAVKNDDGVPIAGAELRALVIENVSQLRLGEEKGRTGSDDNGDYQILVPNGKDYMIYAGAAGYAMKQSHVSWRQAGAEKRIRLDFVLSPAMTISGVVKDAEGNFIQDAVVSPSYQRKIGSDNEEKSKEIAPNALSARTDASGGFLLEGLYAGFYTLAAVKEGYSPALKKDVSSPAENVEIILEKGEGGIIAGSVFYLSSGEAAEGASVKVRSLPFTPDAIIVKTGSAGDFRFSGLIPGVYEISAEKDKAQSMPCDPIDLVKSGEKTDVVLKLFNGYTISGRVYEEKGLKVIPGVKVSARAGLDEQGDYEISDQEGFYQISGIQSGRVFIFGELEGYFHVGDSGANTPKSLELPADAAELRNVDLTMSRGVRVSGRVVAESDQSPISGATARFVTDARMLGRPLKPMTTDSEGIFSGYVQNHTRITVRASHPEYAEGSTNPIAVSDKPVENILIELGKGGTVRGVVVDPEEAPVPGASVRGIAPAASAGSRRRAFGRKEAITDAEGRFVMERVPAGEFNLSATAEGYSPSANKLARVPEGGETEEVVIVLSTNYFIQGFVSEESGAPSIGAKITARNIDRPNRVYTSLSESGGAFRVQGVIKGKYRVKAEKGDMASKAVEAEHNSANLALILREKESATLYGRVVDANTGEPVKSYRLRAESGGKIYGNFYNPEGAFFIEGLTRGRNYRFYIEASGFVTTLSPFVAIPREEEPPDATFEIGKGGAIFGRVLYDINKSPVNGAKITCVLTSRSTQGSKVGSGEVSFTGKDGIFLFEGIAPGEYAIKAEKTGYPELAAECRVNDGEITDVGELLLKASGRIRGKVLDNQAPAQPVPDKIVNLSGVDMIIPIHISYKTDSDGVYVFKDLPEGKYRIKPVGNEYRAIETELKPGETKTIQFKPR